MLKLFNSVQYKLNKSSLLWQHVSCFYIILIWNVLKKVSYVMMLLYRVFCRVIHI